jgi:hypothetical protein
MNKNLLTAFVTLCAVSHTKAQVRVPSIYSTACGKISALTIGYLDTTATYVDGRIINGKTKQPIHQATIQVAYYDCLSVALKTRKAVANDSGFFNLGWVGCFESRLLEVKGLGYCTLRTSKVQMGGKSEITVELMPLAAEDKHRHNSKGKK